MTQEQIDRINAIHRELIAARDELKVAIDDLRALPVHPIEMFVVVSEPYKQGDGTWTAWLSGRREVHGFVATGHLEPILQRLDKSFKFAQAL